MQPHHLVSTAIAKENFIFSFDFGMLCGNFFLGRTQAAYPSVKKAASSTLLKIKWTISCRAAQICKTSLAKGSLHWDIMQDWCLRLQAQPVPRTFRGRGRLGRQRLGRVLAATSPQPALFYCAKRPCFPLRALRSCNSSPIEIGAITVPMLKRAIC